MSKHHTEKRWGIHYTQITATVPLPFYCRVKIFNSGSSRPVVTKRPVEWLLARAALSRWWACIFIH